ncbi:uncharacterized protein LOC106670271 [Cimex lectularius]|uniref:Uncharacterized protein n=1 Tax=Cimex lectularius TaxID=79782 RepID=A0A8I6S2H7_CIMLE|nr:uncharacterized protein LOC106670271 [Cimex lectularius]
MRRIVPSFFQHRSMSKKNKEKPECKTPKQVDLDKNGHIRIRVSARPGCKTSAVVGFEDEGVLVQIGAPPVDGEANSELIKFMAQFLGLRKSSVTLGTGHKSKNKVLLISDSQLTVDQVIAKLKTASND